MSHVTSDLPHIAFVICEVSSRLNILVAFGSIPITHKQPTDTDLQQLVEGVYVNRCFRTHRLNQFETILMYFQFHQSFKLFDSIINFISLSWSNPKSSKFIDKLRHPSHYSSCRDKQLMSGPCINIMSTEICEHNRSKS